MQSNAAKAGVLAALVAVAAVLFIVLSGGDDSDSDSTTTTEQSGTVTTPAEPPAPEAFEVQLRGGAPVGGVAELEAIKGDTVRIAISSDEDAELHIHGYEIEDELTAGKTTQVKFTADIDGKFEIEAHSHETGDIPLAELTVQPG